MTGEPIKNPTGLSFTDADGRALAVTEYRPGAADGREVVGMLVAREGSAPQPYATSVKVFEPVWLERMHVCPREIQEANSK